MLFGWKKTIRNFIPLLLLAVMVSCCPSSYTQGTVYVPEAAGNIGPASIYASCSPIDIVTGAKTENKASYITDNTHTEEHPIHQNKSAMLFCSMAISLSAAVLCVYILHAVTKAISANLYVIRYIHKTDGMK